MNTPPRPPFQILIIDDQADFAALTSKAVLADDKKRNPLLALAELHQELTDLADNVPPNWKVIVSLGAKLQESEITVILTQKEHAVKPSTSTPQERQNLLKSIDVLVLDLGDVGQLWTRPLLETVEANLRRVSGVQQMAVAPEHVTAIGKEKYSGVGFYHQHLEHLEGCKGVFILTQHDTGQYADCIKKLLDPFCGAENFRPYTVKFSKAPETTNGQAVNDIQKITQRLRVLYELHQDGYTLQDKLSEIEFAASHDLPVMLCGESGTGKENLAKSIHRRWALRKIAEGKLDDDAIKRFAVINCSVLTRELAGSELFGHLEGSYTGAADSSLGKILSAGCGIPLKRIRRTSKTTTYTTQQEPDADSVPDPQKGQMSPLEELLLRSDKRLEKVEGSSDLRVMRPASNSTTNLINNSNSKTIEPLGTLFLDEFGDLPPDVQPKLLRYLESCEVQMTGLNGVIKGACLRIITATSDPRFAAFAGFTDDKNRLKGQWRSLAELATPLRSDLLFRVKSQTLRATPVTAGKGGNVEDITRRLVLSHAKAEWTDNAIAQVVKIFTKQIEEVNKVEKMSPREREQCLDHLPIFGHLREISRFIQLADVYASTHRECGGRRLDGKVTPEVVEWLWKPSAVYRASGLGGGDQPIPPAQEQKTMTKACQIRSEFRAKMSAFGQNLTEDFTQKAVRQAAKNLTASQRKSLSDWMSTYTDGNEAWVKTAFSQAFKTEEEASVKGGTVRTWFADSRSKAGR